MPKGFSIDCKIDLKGLEGKFTEEGLDNARMLLCERIHQHCEPIVPKDTGALRMSRTTGASHDELGWNCEYARAVYNMTDKAKYTTPDTSGHWFEKAKQSKLQDWKQVVKEALT